MNIFQAILIAIIEGITEFLPISSTAHMKFANPFLGIADTPFVDLFEIVIQLAAIGSIVVIYYKRFFDFKKLNEIQQKHSNILVINPWIEFINYEFIATRHLIIKEDKNFLFSKSFYLFIN